MSRQEVFFVLSVAATTEQKYVRGRVGAGGACFAGSMPIIHLILFSFSSLGKVLRKVEPGAGNPLGRNQKPSAFPKEPTKPAPGILLSLLLYLSPGQRPYSRLRDPPVDFRPRSVSAKGKLVAFNAPGGGYTVPERGHLIN